MTTHLTLRLPSVPAGISLTGARPGENAVIVVQESCTNSDGAHWIRRVEAFDGVLFSRLGRPNFLGQPWIHSCLAVIRSDGQTRCLIDWQPTRFEVQAGRDITPGRAVTTGDILAITDLPLGDFSIPTDCGFVAVQRYGWRQSLTFDLGPLTTGAVPRAYSASQHLARQLSFMVFEDLHRLTEAEWAGIIGQGWFPFAVLGPELIDRMIAHYRSGFALDELLDEVQAQVNCRLDDRRQHIRRSSLLADHLPFLDRALQQLEQSDFISAASILLPRIEGILRTFHSARSISTTPTQSSMPELVGQAATEDPRLAWGLLLPGAFQRFLRESFFGWFDWQHPEGISRNTVGHGVLDAQNARKAAIIGALTLWQLMYFTPRRA